MKADLQNGWYSDSEAVNGSVADGVFVKEEKWQLWKIIDVFVGWLSTQTVTL